MEQPIFLNGGGGTVGCRTMRLLLSMGKEIIFSKKAIDFKDGRLGQKTMDLIHLQHNFKKIPPMYVVAGEGLESRINDFKDSGFDVRGSVDELDFKKISQIIDVSPSGEASKWNYERYYHLYPEHNFLLQGKGNFSLVDPGKSSNGAGFFMSAPNAIGAKMDYHGKNAIQGSCNSTFISTCLGLVLDCFKKEEIRYVSALLNRRNIDPEIESSEYSIELAKGGKQEIGSHHKDDVEVIIPELKGKIVTIVSTNPWKHYHRVAVTIDFHNIVSKEAIESLKDRFRRYERCIFVEKPKIDAQGLYSACEDINVPDGDCLIPLYSLDKLTDHYIVVQGFTPQRSIVGMSILDWLWLVRKEFDSWKDAFDHTNANIKWYNHSLEGLKHELQSRLN